MVYSTSQLITIVADAGGVDPGGAFAVRCSFARFLVYCCMGRCTLRKIVVLFHNRFEVWVFDVLLYMLIVLVYTAKFVCIAISTSRFTVHTTGNLADEKDV